MTAWTWLGGVWTMVVAYFGGRREQPESVVPAVERLVRARVVRIGKQVYLPRGHVVVVAGGPLWTSISELQVEWERHLGEVATRAARAAGAAGVTVAVMARRGAPTEAGFELRWEGAPVLTPPAAPPVPADDRTRRATHTFLVRCADASFTVSNERKSVGGAPTDHLRVAGQPTRAFEVWLDEDRPAVYTTVEGVVVVGSGRMLPANTYARTAGAVFRAPSGLELRVEAVPLR